jgi:hypothetical protein
MPKIVTLYTGRLVVPRYNFNWLRVGRAGGFC